jgi:hypothetical protein
MVGRNGCWIHPIGAGLIPHLWGDHGVDHVVDHGVYYGDYFGNSQLFQQFIHRPISHR